ncbi:MAG: hypothetical protein HRK26_01930 [Rickettsiaceae bacterium H1]|nr:hypothetical protein [Rickettsiaceae bacterium H1]
MILKLENNSTTKPNGHTYTNIGNNEKLETIIELFEFQEAISNLANSPIGNAKDTSEIYSRKLIPTNNKTNRIEKQVVNKNSIKFTISFCCYFIPKASL